MATGTTRKTGNKTEETNVAEVMKQPSKYDKDELQDAKTFDDFMRLAATTHDGVVAVHETELGDGFKVASEADKRRLIGRPLLFMEWSFNKGDYSDFVSARVVEQTESGALNKWILNDGGTGIYTELRNYTAKTGREGGLFCRNGLRVSDYFVDGEKGSDTFGRPLSRDEITEYYKQNKKVSPAATFYLDTTA